MHHLVKSLWSDDQAQDLIEYALMLTLILLLSVAAIQGIGTRVGEIFTAVNTAIASS